MVNTGTMNIKNVENLTVSGGDETTNPSFVNNGDLIIDIISKRLVISFMLPDMSINIIDNFFSITYARNEGIAFSLLDGKVDFIVIMTIIIIFMLIKYLKENKVEKNEKIGYSFVLGGAIGNLLDRIIYGYVIDFFDFNIFGYNYPIFNIADIFIVIGIFILIISGGKKDGDKNGINSR